jgi:hypothetical protein
MKLTLFIPLKPAYNELPNCKMAFFIRGLPQEQNDVLFPCTSARNTFAIMLFRGLKKMIYDLKSTRYWDVISE